MRSENSECEDLLRRFAVPAVGLARIDATGIASLCCLGERKQGSGIAVMESDLWHIGSCTKSMTATLLARLVERGELEWEAPVAPMFAAGGVEVHPDFAGLTLRHLLNHRSGMPTDPPASEVEASLSSPNPLYTLRAALAANAMEQRPTQQPGEAFCYSNLGYVVAAAIAEGVTGTAWEELIRCEVFSPLGLTSAGFGAPGQRSGLGRLFGPEHVTQPWGHQLDADTDSFVPLSPDDVLLADSAPAMGPAGTVHLSLPDLGRYVAFHVSRGATAPGYLRPEMIETLHTPLPGEGYALGWFAMTAEESGIGNPVIWHEGSNNAWYAAMLLVPDIGRAWAFVCNGYRDLLQDQRTGLLIALGEIDGDWLSLRDLA